MTGPKEWFPGKPWVAAGHEEWEFEDTLTWLVYEAAKLGLWSRMHDERDIGGGMWFRFDGRKLAKSFPEAVLETGYRLKPDELKEAQGFGDIVGAILRGPGDDVWSLDLYDNRWEFQGDWAEIKGRGTEGR